MPTRTISNFTTLQDVTIDNMDASGTINSKAFQISDEDGNENVKFVTPTSLSASYQLTLPPNDGGSGQVLTTDGTGILSWTAGGGGTGDINNGGDAGAITVGSTDNTFTLLSNNTAAALIDITGNLNLLTENELRLQDTTGGQYAGFKAAGTTTASYTLTMPPAVGASGQVLQTTDGSGTLGWVTSGGSGDIVDGGQTGAISIGTTDATTLSFLTNNVSAIEIDITGNLNLLTENELRLQDTTGGQYAGFKAAGTTTASYTLTMPPAVGSTGQILKTTNGTGTLDWITPNNVRTEAGSGTINITATTDHIVRFTTTSATPTTVNLPVSSTVSGQEYTFVKIGATDGILNITATGGDTIDGALSSVQLAIQHDRVRVFSDGNGVWYTV